MKKILFILLAVISSCKVSTAPPDQAVEKLGPNPYIQIDGAALASPSELQNYNENDIASAETFYGKSAMAKFGEQAKDGAIIFETKSFARNKYRSFFSSISEEYNKIISDYEEEDIQYVLNGKVLEQNYEGDLATINNERLKAIIVLTQAELESRYGVTDKRVGVLIEANAPKDLHNAKGKF